LSSFEFILVSIAIVLGFGISEVLADWGRVLRHRKEVRPYPLQLAASAFVLYASLRYLWLLWDARHTQWTYVGYLLIFAPALCLALAANLVRADPTSLRRSPKEQYFEATRPLFLLIAALPGLSAINVWLHAEEVRSEAMSVANPLIWAYWPAFIATCLLLSRSRSERWHAVGWSFLWLSTLALSTRVATTLAPS